MARKIKWSPEAAADRLQILEYWFERTGDKRYSKKLDKGFREVNKDTFQVAGNR